MNTYKVLTKEPVGEHKIDAESYKWDFVGAAQGARIMMLIFKAEALTVAEFRADNVVLVQKIA